MDKKDGKIKEADYFLLEMKRNEEQFEIFEFNLSAFINAARSAQQYMYEEIKHQETVVAGTLKWYEDWVGSHPVLKYFKEKRDINVHEKPVRIDSRSVTIKMGLSYEIENNTKKGTPLKWEQETTSETVHKFTDWNGNEAEAMGLCTHYLSDLKSLIAEGRAKGYIG